MIINKNDAGGVLQWYALRRQIRDCEREACDALIEKLGTLDWSEGKYSDERMVTEALEAERDELYPLLADDSNAPTPICVPLYSVPEIVHSPAPAE